MKIWWHKAAAWGGFLLLLWIVRDFLPLVFVTFVLTFIMSTAVRALSAYTRHRRFVCTALYALLVLVLIGLAGAIGPRLAHETRAVLDEYAVRLEVARMREANGEDGSRPSRRAAARRLSAAEAAGDAAPETGTEGVRRVVDRAAERVLGERAARTFRTTDIYEVVAERAIEAVEMALSGLTDRIIRAGGRLPFLILQVVLSVLFSFFIVWDMPRLAASVRSLERGRLAHVYAEIAPGVVDFGRVMGIAFGAQAAIAVANTIFTGIGLWLLGIPKIALLLLIVFFCSFIPVLGVILSTIPIGIFAAKAGGATLLLAAVVMVLVVHAIEAYLLNPNIYGQALHMHPLIVLCVLLVAEHLAGIWGLLLGVPVSYYVFEYVIQGKTGWPPRLPGETGPA